MLSPSPNSCACCQGIDQPAQPTRAVPVFGGDFVAMARFYRARPCPALNG
jgi:hypothetical protein